MSRWTLGSITIDRVLEHERTVFPLNTLYPTARAELLEPHRAWLAPRVIDPTTELLVLAFHTFAVRTPDARSSSTPARAMTSRVRRSCATT